MRSTETGQIKQVARKAYIIIAFILFGLVSCSKAVKFQRELPEMIKYNKVEFVECPADISGYLCIKNTDAINSVIDLKNCQEQNRFLREMLDGD
jgi:hypothetical protein|tara:strand:- start:695 stop:976 length:282 start_codon:yes stop_codon:yes gene_type:complete